MIINLLNQYYQGISVDQNSTDLVNMYLEEDKNNGKYPVIARPTPGLSVFNNTLVTPGVVRAGINYSGTAYFVIGSGFYSYSSTGVATLLGTLSSSSGMCQMAGIVGQLMIIDANAGYIYQPTTATFAKITDLNFPANFTPTPAVLQSLTAQDGFFIITITNSPAVYASNVADGTTWNALSFQNKVGPSDNTNGVVSNKEYLLVFGHQISNIWYNAGNATFAFSPIGLGGYFHFGCAAVNSIATGNNACIWLGKNPNGGYSVFTLTSYNPQAISNRALDETMRTFSTVSDAFGYCFRYGGHEFYCLTFPTANRSFLFDFTTEMWSEFVSNISGIYGRHISSCHVFAYGKNLVGDSTSTTIYYFDETNNTENSTLIKRQIVSPPGYGEGLKVFTDKLQYDFENVGGNLPVTLEVSKDSGHTYPTTYSTNVIPSAGNRCYFTRLGMTQNAFVFRLTCIQNVKFVVLGAFADVRKGIN